MALYLSGGFDGLFCCFGGLFESFLLHFCVFLIFLRKFIFFPQKSALKDYFDLHVLCFELFGSEEEAGLRACKGRAEGLTFQSFDVQGADL